MRWLGQHIVDSDIYIEGDLGFTEKSSDPDNPEGKASLD